MVKSDESAEKAVLLLLTKQIQSYSVANGWFPLLQRAFKSVVRLSRGH